LVLLTVLGPTVFGVVVRALAPKLAARITTPLEVAAVVLLLGGAVLILIKLWPAMLAEIGDGTLLAIIAFVVLGLAAGYLLGGPASGDRTVLGLATAIRHPAIAMTIGHLAFPAEKAVPAAVLLYLLTGTIVTAPYVAWRKKAHAREHPVAAMPSAKV
jgi:BASS family bile acid:Na+ symporter